MRQIEIVILVFLAASVRLSSAEPFDSSKMDRFHTFTEKWINEHTSRLYEHVHTRQLGLFWEIEFPDKQTVEQYKVVLEGKGVKTIDWAEHWARTLLVEKMTPNDLRMRFIALNDIPTKPPTTSEFGKVADKLVAQYQVEKTSVELQEDGMNFGILLKFPPLAAAKSYDQREFILEKMKAYFRIPETEMENVVFDYFAADGIYAGTIFFGKWSPASFPGEPDRYWRAFRHWWPAVAFATDLQSFFFVSFVEQDGEKNISPIPGLRYSRF